MEIILFEVALTFYFAATIVSLLELSKGTRTTSRIMLGLTAIGFFIHTLNIITRYIVSGHIPITNMHEATSFFCMVYCVDIFLS